MIKCDICSELFRNKKALTNKKKFLAYHKNKKYCSRKCNNSYNYKRRKKQNGNRKMSNLRNR